MCTYIGQRQQFLHVYTGLLLQILEETLAAMLAALPNLLLVITSRRPLAFVDLAHGDATVEQLATEDAQQLMTQAAPNMSKVDAAELARLCGNIPYLLRIVGCFIERGDATAEVSQALAVSAVSSP